MARRLAGIVLGALLLAACADDGGDAEVGTAATEQDADGATDARLGIIDPGVDVADEPAAAADAAFRTGEDGEGLVVGDLVRTDDAGFAEVAWFDGALARVDAETLYALTELDATPGSAVVRTELDVGRIWNRLRDDVAETYEVDTDVATAAVRGTAFWVTCAGACTFAVLEGEVVVTTTDGAEVVLVAGEQVTVAEDGVPDAVVSTDPEDPWVLRNAPLDEAAGFDPLPELAQPAVASGPVAEDCPLRAIPAGFERAPFPDDAPGLPEASSYCYLVATGAGPGDPAVLRYARPFDADAFRAEIIEANRQQFEANLAEKRSDASTCSEGADGVFTEFDEPLGDGRLVGFSWQTTRGVFSDQEGQCNGQVGLAYYGFAIDGVVMGIVSAPYEEGLSHSDDCPQGLGGQVVQDSELAAYNACLYEAKEARDAEYRELGAVVLGG